MSRRDRAGKRYTVPIHKTLSDMNINQRVISLSSRGFDPKLFLLEVHGSTSFTELVNGIDNLKKSIKERQDLSRKLVKQNFNRFVIAKSLVDSESFKTFQMHY